MTRMAYTFSMTAATLDTVEAVPVSCRVSVELESQHCSRIKPQSARFVGLPAAATVCDAVIPGTATPSLSSATVTVPAAVGAAVTDTETS